MALARLHSNQKTVDVTRYRRQFISLLIGLALLLSACGGGEGSVNSTSGFGVKGEGPIAIKAVGNAVQTPGFGGWAKSMVIVDVTKPAGQQIARYYNSQLTGAAMNTVPCGYLLESSVGQWRVIFGFDTWSPFAAATQTDDQSKCFVSSCDIPRISGITYENDSVIVVARKSSDSYLSGLDSGFTLILY